MKEVLIRRYQDFENFMQICLSKSSSLETQAYYGYGGGGVHIFAKGTGFLGMFKHVVAEVSDNEVFLKDNSYYSDIVDCIKSYESKTKIKITLKMYYEQTK